MIGFKASNKSVTGEIPVYNKAYPRTPLHDRNFPVVCLFSQKSGCTFLTKWFFWHLGLLDEALAYNKWIHQYREDIFIKNDNYYKNLEKVIINQEKPVIKLLRNPYERTISSFLSLGIKRKLRNHWTRHTFSKITEKYYGEQCDNKGITFDQFLLYIENRNFNDLDPHIAPQIYRNEINLVEHWFILDTVNIHFTELEKEYNLQQSPLENFKSSSHNKIQTDESINREEFSKFELKLDMFSDSVPNYSNFLTPDTIKLIERAYPTDVRIFKENCKTV